MSTSLKAGIWGKQGCYSPKIMEKRAPETIGSYAVPMKRTGSPSYIYLGESLCPAGRVAWALARALLSSPRKVFAKSWD